MPAKTKTTKGRKKGKGRTKTNRGVNQDLVKSLAHELRAEILAILNERMASPNELAKELDEGLSQVSYHVKVLKDYGVIRLVKTEPRRGAVEHYYRATSRALPDRSRLARAAQIRRVGDERRPVPGRPRRRRRFAGGRRVRRPRGSSPELDADDASTSRAGGDHRSS